MFTPREIMVRCTAAVCLAVALFASISVAQAGRVNVLYGFKGGNDGGGPQSAPIGDDQGNLYGTTLFGGGTGCRGQGCGTIFKLAPDGTETVLHAFKSGSTTADPSGLVRDESGNLYGTTANEVYECANTRDLCGTAYRLAPDGTFTVLHAFSGGSDGELPSSGLLRDKSGNLYGEAIFGGTNNAGVVYKIAPDGTESLLYSFCSVGSCLDGYSPVGGLIADGAGNLYGVTAYGGTTNSGTVFKLSRDGTETVLYSFCSQPSCVDGVFPQYGVSRDKAGNIYGTTSNGGAFSLDQQWGTVFKVAPDGTETVLHSFSPNVDGGEATSGMLIDHAGNLFGTIVGSVPCEGSGGSPVYRLSPDGSEKLYCVRGGLYGGVIERNGYLYGTGEDGNGKRDSWGLVYSVKK